MNSTHTFVGGGNYFASYSNDAFLFDWTSQEWIKVIFPTFVQTAQFALSSWRTSIFAQLTDMLIPRQHPACIGLSDGRVMVAGGVTEDTVEFYHPETNSWLVKGCWLYTLTY